MSPCKNGAPTQSVVVYCCYSRVSAVLLQVTIGRTHTHTHTSPVWVVRFDKLIEMLACSSAVYMNQIEPISNYLDTNILWLKIYVCGREICESHHFQLNSFVCSFEVCVCVCLTPANNNEKFSKQNGLGRRTLFKGTLLFFHNFRFFFSFMIINEIF